MSKTSKRSILLGLSLLFVLSLSFSLASAQVPDKQREFVYGMQTFTGLRYEATFYPLTVDTIYVMADVVNIISPKESLVYFWPITNDLKADWDGLNETVGHTLEILQGGSVIETVTQTTYVIQYPNGYDSGVVNVYLGDEAAVQYDVFDQARAEFRDGVAAYYEASRNYRAELSRQVEAGEVEDDILIPPEEPLDFLFFSTGIFDGIPLQLSEGNYTIRVRDSNGDIIPESERKLVAFNPTRQGVNYDIIPYDKWTTPEQSDDPSQVLYAKEDSIMYLQPSNELEYNELYYARVRNPQDILASQDRWTWVPMTPIEQGTLEILQNGQVVDRVERRPYVVRQYTGSALGYEIIDQRTAEEERFRTRTPDFEAYQIKVNSGQSDFSIRLVDPEGRVVPGSERAVKLVNTTNPQRGYLLPVIPLILGVLVSIWRSTKLGSLPKQGEVA